MGGFARRPANRGRKRKLDCEGAEGGAKKRSYRPHHYARTHQSITLHRRISNMRFRYSRIPLPEPSSVLGSFLFKPIIPIILAYQGRAVRYGALIDSGADFCMLDGLMGEFLGIDVRAGTKVRFGGVEQGTGAEAYFHTVTVKIGEVESEVNVGFSYDIADYGFALLGQNGFFDHFAVRFDLLKDEIALTKKK